MDESPVDPDLERALGSVFFDERPWDLLTRLTELPERFGGHPGEERAAEHVADALDAAGLQDVSLRTFDLTRWSPGRTSLTIAGDPARAFEAVALPYSPSVERTAPIVDVGYGSGAEIEAADPEDAFAVASTAHPPGFNRHVHRMETVGQAAAAGARGIFLANHRSGQLPPTGTLYFDDSGAIPGAGVSKETGEWLREYAIRDVEARLRIDASTSGATSQNVVGTVGPETDDEILVLAHYDAHDVGEGALDNGAGVAVLTGVANLMTDIDLDCRVRFAATGCEEVGLLGSEALAERLDHERIRAVVNVDGAGRYPIARAMTHGSDAFDDTVERVAETLSQTIHTSSLPHPYSDHWPFLRNGVPALQLHSEKRDAGGGWDRGYAHTRGDTRDKVEPTIVQQHAALTALLIRELTRTDVDRLEPATIRDALREAGAEPGMRAADVWPAEWTEE